MMDVYVSDLHLDAVDSPRFQTFTRVLEDEAPRCRSIYILGDLAETWIGDDDDGPLADALKTVLRKAADVTSVHIMPGNRDFLMGDDFAASTGCQLLPDPFQRDAATLLAHGDALCLDDADYQRRRREVRSESWQNRVLAMSLDERRALAAGLRRESKASIANKPMNIMDVNDAEVARVVRAAGARRLIHGHTHRAGIHTAPWGTRYVLGDWDRCGWLLRDCGELQLECFPVAGGPL